MAGVAAGIPGSLSTKTNITNVYQIDPLSDARWATLVKTHPHSSVFHSPNWLKGVAHGLRLRAHSCNDECSRRTPLERTRILPYSELVDRKTIGIIAVFRSFGTLDRQPERA